MHPSRVRAVLPLLASKIVAVVYLTQRTHGHSGTAHEMNARLIDARRHANARPSRKLVGRCAYAPRREDFAEELFV